MLSNSSASGVSTGIVSLFVLRPDCLMLLSLTFVIHHRALGRKANSVSLLIKNFLPENLIELSRWSRQGRAVVQLPIERHVNIAVKSGVENRKRSSASRGFFSCSAIASRASGDRLKRSAKSGADYEFQFRSGVNNERPIGVQRLPKTVAPTLAARRSLLPRSWRIRL